LEVEQALQSIDPSVSIAYWEYGIDYTEYNILEESVIFDQDWYGESNPRNSEHKISDSSFWSNITMPSGAKYMKSWDMKAKGYTNPYVNGYGQMRTPYNNNPSPYIGRYNMTYGVTFFAIPSCTEFFKCYNSTSLAEVSDLFNLIKCRCILKK
jgi:hypothetical protein